MTLTIYTNDYDTEDSISNGFSGDVFIENGTTGIWFKKDLSGALKHIVKNNIEISEIMFCYRDSNDQMFKKFAVG
jgi:hypothetical protein